MRFTLPFSPAVSDTLVRVEELAIFVQREAVGHTRDVVGNDAGERLAVTLDAREHMLGHLARLAHIGVEQLLEHPARLFRHSADAIMTIKPVAHHLFEFCHLIANSGAEAHERTASAAHLVDAVDSTALKLAIDVG